VYGFKRQTGICVGVHNILKKETDIDKVCARWMSRHLRDHKKGDSGSIVGSVYVYLANSYL